MQGVNRTLVNPPVSSRAAFAALDARRELEHDEAIADESGTPEPSDAAIYKSAAEQLRAHADRALRLANEMDPQPEQPVRPPIVNVGVYAFPLAGGPGFCIHRARFEVTSVDSHTHRFEVHVSHE